MSGALAEALLFRRYSSAGLANAAADRLAGNGKVVFRPEGNSIQPFVVEPVRKQLNEAARMLALFAVAAPCLFLAADWLRYSA